MRLGIDVGGTFTDFVLSDPEGHLRLVKVSSSPGDPSRALRDGFAQIAAAIGKSVAEILTECELILHGTTVVTNALVQASGARTALLCTEGFRDTFEIRQAHKEKRYDLEYRPPPMLVPRRLRLPIRERITKDGEIAVPLDELGVRAQLEALKEENIEAVAVCFLWSFMNDLHERRVGELIRELLPHAYLSLSVDVLPQIREYARTSTTILNAFVGPLLTQYLAAFDNTMREQGYEGPIRYVQANGGLAARAALVRRPIYALNSGPATGPTAALYFAADQLGQRNVLSADMGGTSFEICLVQDGLPEMVNNVDVCRYRTGFPMVNIRTIGAGGGSIAWVDEGQMIRVGPESAGAVPGPACYGRGGSAATVTDANVVLGYVSDTAILGGEVTIEPAAARAAVKTSVADPLGITVEEASAGIFTVLNSNMTRAIAEVSIERGHDPRDFPLVIGGGAGAIHALRLADELDIQMVIVPRVAAGLCGFGELVADLRHDYGASYLSPLVEADCAVLTRLYEEMEHLGLADLEAEGVSAERVALSRWMDVRYKGQIHECAIPVPLGVIDGATLEECMESFHAAHEALYAYSERGAGTCEMLNIGATARGLMARPETAEPAVGWADGDMHSIRSRPVTQSRRAYFPELGGFGRTPVFDAESVAMSVPIPGPAIIEESTTTIVITPGWEAERFSAGFYVLTRTGSRGEVARTRA